MFHNFDMDTQESLALEQLITFRPPPPPPPPHTLDFLIDLHMNIVLTHPHLYHFLSCPLHSY